MSRWGKFVCALALVAAGCGDDDVVVPQDGSTADGGAGSLVVAPPALPAPLEAAPAPAELPRLTTCPMGWRSVPAGTDGSTAPRCEPFDGDRLPACENDEIALPGTPACTRLGTACPTDGWPADLPAGATVLYVRAGASATGTGTRADPFATVAAALAVAAPGTVVAIAMGTYDELLAVPMGVTLLGACVSGTRIAATTAGTTSATVTVRGTDVVLRNLSLGGSSRALVASRGASVMVHDVATTGSAGRAWTALAGSHIVAHDVAFRDTAPGRAGEGHAIRVEAGADVTIDRAVIERSSIIAVYVIGRDATLRLRDATVSATARAAAGSYGRGVVADEGARVELDRVVVEDSGEIGIAAWGSTLRLTDLVVRRTTSDAGMSGIGLQLADGAMLEGRRIQLDSNASSSLLALGAGTTLLLEDTVVRRSLPDAQGHFGFGAAIRLGASAHFTRVLVEASREIAVHTLDTDTSLVAEDLTIRDTVPDATGASGRGLEAGPGSSMEATRVDISMSHVVGAFCAGDERLALGAMLVLRDVRVTDTAPSADDGSAGHGIEARHGCALTVERARIERTHDVALAGLDDGTVVVASDIEIVGVLRASGLGANGLQAQTGASVTVTRARVTEIENTAVVALDRGHMTVTDLDVGDRVGPAPRDAASVALYAAQDGTLEVTRARVPTTYSHTVFTEGEETRAVIHDLSVLSTGAPELPELGAHGPLAQYGAALELERIDLDGLAELAIVGLSPGTELVLRDATIHDLRGRVSDGLGGVAIYLGNSVHATLERVRVTRARDVAILARGDGTTLSARAIEVTETLARACAETTCRENPSGMGLGLYENASGTVDDFLVSRAALAGVQLAEGGGVDLSNGEVSSCPIGANVQTDGFDLRRITNNVVFRDNARNVAADSLPVPDLTVPPLD